MNINVLRSMSAIIVMLLFISAVAVPPSTSTDNIIQSEIEQLGLSKKSDYGIYIFCEIKTNNSGRALLFPGYFNSINNYINVKGATGICFIGEESMSAPININGNNVENWVSMLVILYTGILENYWLNLPPKPKPVFSLDGNALMVIVKQSI